ncbi:MAG: glutamate--tRNA ligase [bacterium]|nr:glutamate--tRNA ligase [bacterium]
MDKKPIITRFAPSPTGELHIGGARTALFEYLFAKHLGGEFLLRIEDTDRARFVEGSVERIIESLSWLGLGPDNIDLIPLQSDRIETYKKHAFDLVKAGHAYVCTCAKERLEEVRHDLEKVGQPPHYDRHCRIDGFEFKDLTEGCYVIRMKMPREGRQIVHDLIRGDVEFDLSLLDDQIILKSDGFPTYHLASVVDDHEAEITHVIRAEEWLSSTPKHLVLYEMFGWTAPEFAHLPMVLAPDRTKLSKRHGATSVEEYKKLGYLPEAIINFLALMGWNPKTEREFFTLDELIAEFRIENINKAPAIFNIEKLNNINEHYIVEEIRNPCLAGRQAKSEIRNKFKNFKLENISNGELELIGRGGYKTLKEAAEYISKLRQMPDYKAELLIFKKSSKPNTLKGLQDTRNKVQDTKDWNIETMQQLLADVVSEGGFNNGDVFWPIRVALSGEEKSPSPVELAVALGKEKTLERIEKAISELN